MLIFYVFDDTKKLELSQGRLLTWSWKWNFSKIIFSGHVALLTHNVPSSESGAECKERAPALRLP